MLRYPADRRTLAFVCAYFALVATAWLSEPATLAGKILLVAAICCASFFCAVITHNTIHAPIFHSGAMNRAFQVVLTLAYGHPVSAYVSGHNLSHHRYTQRRQDVMRTTKLRFRWNLLNQLLFLPVVSTAIMYADFSFTRAMWRERPRWFRQFLVEASIFLSSQMIFLALDWRKLLLYVVLPHLWAAWGIVGMNYPQHDGCDADHAYNHSRSFVGPIINWLTFNNGYHGIHHMEPTLHWSLLPAGHAERLHGRVHPNLEQPNFLAWLWRAFVWPGRRLRYDGKPVVLPEEGPDEDWIPGSSAGVGDLGAVS